jgi:hypothetical protein
MDQKRKSLDHPCWPAAYTTSYPNEAIYSLLNAIEPQEAWPMSVARPHTLRARKPCAPPCSAELDLSPRLIRNLSPRQDASDGVE